MMANTVIPCNVHLSGLPPIPSPHVLVVDSALFVQNNFFCLSLKYSFVREPFESIVSFWQDFGAVTSSKRYFPFVIFCLRVSLMTALVLGTSVVISPPKFSFFFLSVKWTGFQWVLNNSTFTPFFPKKFFHNHVSHFCLRWCSKLPCQPREIDLWNNDKKLYY